MAAVTSWDYYTCQLTSYADTDVSIEPCSECEYLAFIPQDHHGNINVLELIAVYLVLLRWRDVLYNHRIIINCDNKQVCYMLYRDRSKMSWHQLFCVVSSGYVWKITCTYLPNILHLKTM